MTAPRLHWLLVVAAPLFSIPALGQGSLAPPGSPGPSMKSLEQVKAGIPIDPSKPGFTTPFAISASGNYFLTGNIAVTSGDAIVITTSGVTLDLNGFTISSSASPIGGSGIFVSNPNHDVTISNGHITGNVTLIGTGAGFSVGLAASGGCVNLRVTGVSVFGCQSGIQALRAIVESCNVDTIALVGIFAAEVRGCSATNCGNTAISATVVSDSAGVSLNSDGINATIVHNSRGTSNNAGSGIVGASAQNCFGATGSGTAILISGSASNCYGNVISGGGIGIFLGTHGTLNGCQTNSTISAGSFCTLLSCSAAGISTGPGGNLANCVAQNSFGNGISVGSGSTVSHCTAWNSGGVGIVLGDNSIAQNCTASGDGGDGITVTNQSTVTNCNACANGGDGIHLIAGGSTDNRIDGNNASNNAGIGIHQTGGPDLIIRNFARNNTSGINYSPSSGTSVGPVGLPNSATSPWANFQ